MELNQKRVLVYGTGKSGIGAANFLLKVNAIPVFYDERDGIDEEAVKAQMDPTLDVHKVQFQFGVLTQTSLQDVDLVVMSPGVPCDIPNVRLFHDMEIPVIGEIELAYTAEKGEVIAITGTNGKTTTTALVGEIMKAYVQDVFVVGNIGNAYTNASLSTNKESVTVAEISSFQLETIQSFHPKVSAILNITEDHLNRHHTMQEYSRVKELITCNQRKEDTCVLNYEDEELRQFAKSCPASVLFFSSRRELEHGIYLDGDRIVFRHDNRDESVLNVNDLTLLGIHNYENVMAAIGMTYAAGVPLPVIAEACRNFQAVAHRIEFVGEKHGVTWYNDSKGTNPDAAIKGIQAMKRPTLLIAGGYDKGSDYREWITSFDGKVKYLVLEGATRFQIRDTAIACGYPEAQIIMKENMEEAMEFCRDHAVEGDAVLLSPACASWGEFPNFEVRGDRFREYVRKEV